MPGGRGLFVVAVLAVLGGAVPAEPKEAPSSSPPSLHCQVVNLPGMGVKDALIVVHVPDGTGWIPVAAGRTDHTGECELALPEGTPGPLLLEVSAPGYHRKSVPFLPRPDLAVPWQTIVLAGATSLRGRVESEAGKAISAATVTLESAQGQRQTKTDGDGRFAFRDLLPLQGRLRVTMPGYAIATERVDLASQKEPLRIVLKPQRRVVLQLLDEQDKPVSGLMVQILGPEPGEALSNADGLVSMDGVGNEPLQVPIRVLDKFYRLERPVMLLRLEGGTEPILLKIKVKRGGRIAGRVLEAGTDGPIPAATVWIAQEGRPVAAEKTDSDGRFALDAVTPGRYILVVSHPVYALSADRVEVASGREVRLDLRLSLGATVSGLIVDGQGKPVRRAVVRAVRWWPAGIAAEAGDKSVPIALPWRAVRADDEGRFRLEHLPAGRVDLQGMKEGRKGRASTVIEVAPDEQVKDVKLILVGD